MTQSLRASTAGLALVDRARQRRGWTKTSTARWWQEAHTSRATLRRFWQQDRIQAEIFIALCAAVGISDWRAIAESEELPEIEPDQPPLPLLNWEEAPDVTAFYGRQTELAQLHQWIVAEQRKRVAIVGLPGVGKTALALAVAEQVQPHFEAVIWRSLQAAPDFCQFMDGLLYCLDLPPLEALAQAVRAVLDWMAKHRCLLILDGWETVLVGGRGVEYAIFLRYWQQGRHPSCLLLTSQEQLGDPSPSGRSTASLTLKGLPKEAALPLLQAQGLTGQELGLTALIHLYRGNPLALKVAAPLIRSVFGGSVAGFLQQHTLVMGDRLHSLLRQQIERLSAQEREILYWLAIWQEPISFSRLQNHCFPTPDPASLLQGIAALESQGLLESWVGPEATALTLQPMVMKVTIDHLVQAAATEIQQAWQQQHSRFQLLRTHWLLRPGTDDITGDRILNRLRELLSQQIDFTLPRVLQQLLAGLQDQAPFAIGYARCNLAALLQAYD